MSEITLAVRVDEDIRQRLDRLADVSGQSLSALVNDVLRHYVEHQERQAEIIRSRREAIASGAVVPIPHEQVLDRLDRRFANRSSE